MHARPRTILKEQDDKSKQADKAMIENLHFVKDLGQQSQAALESDNLPEFARLMDVHWQRKKERSRSMSNQDINDWYDCAMANGALGGKLIGAGGGGFLMFYAKDKARLRHAMREKGLNGSPVPLRLRRHQDSQSMTAPAEEIRLADWPVAILAGGLRPTTAADHGDNSESARGRRGSAVSGSSASAAPFRRVAPDRHLRRLSRRDD